MGQQNDHERKKADSTSCSEKIRRAKHSLLISWRKNFSSAQGKMDMQEYQRPLRQFTFSSNCSPNRTTIPREHIRQKRKIKQSISVENDLPYRR
ncbi:hypothetical protein M514_14018, partial [Trichuris suis]